MSALAHTAPGGTRYSGTVGIVGGMGSAAGVYFAQQLIAQNLDARRDADHVPFVLCSSPAIPSRVDAYDRRGPSPAAPIIESVHRLALAGADFGVVLCNTAHIFFDDISDSVPIPLIHLVRNAALAAPLRPGSRTGLLATSATVRSGLYERYFTGSGGSLALPDASDQEIVSAAIFDQDYGIKATGCQPSRAALEALAGVVERLRRSQGIDQLLLGCTELSLAIPADTWCGLPVLDPVKLLARTCLRRARSPAVAQAPDLAMVLE